MNIEEEIKKLRETEMGGVERVIELNEEISAIKKRTEKEKEELSEEYSILIKEKLYAAMSKFVILKDYLINDEFEEFSVHPRIPRKYSEVTLHALNYYFRILFEKKEDKIKEIGVYTNWSSKTKMKVHWEIKSKSIDNFIEQFTPKVMEGGGGYTLMYRIFDVPQRLQEFYKEHKSIQEIIKEGEVKILSANLEKLRNVQIGIL